MAKLVIMCCSDDPEKAFPPFMLAAGAMALDMDVAMFFAMSGLNIVRKGGAEKITLKGAPKPLPEFLQIARDGGVKFLVCSSCFPIVDMTEEDLIEGTEFAGVAGLLEETEDADVVLTF